MAKSRTHLAAIALGAYFSKRLAHGDPRVEYPDGMIIYDHFIHVNVRADDYVVANEYDPGKFTFTDPVTTISELIHAIESTRKENHAANRYTDKAEG